LVPRGGKVPARWLATAPAQIASSARTGPQTAGEPASATDPTAPLAVVVVRVSGSAGPGQGRRVVFPNDDQATAVQIASTTVESRAGDFHSDNRAAGTVKLHESNPMPVRTKANATTMPRLTDWPRSAPSAASIVLCACATSAGVAVAGSTPRLDGVSTVPAWLSALAFDARAIHHPATTATRRIAAAMAAAMRRRRLESTSRC
jgi:hypothetical protein